MQESAIAFGMEKWCSTEDVLEAYASDLSFAPRIRPQGLVKAATAEEVQRIVKWANETLTPLVPVSSGPPHSYGDTVPGVGGSVIVDLSQMKRIMRVDRRNRVAMIEPGVTFGELIPALKKEDLAALMPLSPREYKSVLTSFLERTPITTPRFHWEPQDPLIAVEVVYGNGDILRTGSAAGPGSIEDQWRLGRAQMRGMGPSQVDFTRLLQGAQGTMGIVTWATIKCRPLARIKKMFFVPSDDIEPLIEFAYKATYRKLGEELFVLNHVNLASLIPGANDRIHQIRRRLPPWSLIFSIEAAGLLPDQKLTYQQQESMEVARSCGLELMDETAGVKAENLSDIMLKGTSGRCRKVPGKSGCGDLFFISTLDKSKGFIEEMAHLGNVCGYETRNMGVYIQPTVQGANAHIEFNLAYNPDDASEADSVKRLLDSGCEKLSCMGAFFSRPYGSWSKIALGRDAQTVMALKKLKPIFDPNHIMNPGRLCF